MPRDEAAMQIILPATAAFYGAGGLNTDTPSLKNKKSVRRGIRAIDGRARRLQVCQRVLTGIAARVVADADHGIARRNEPEKLGGTRVGGPKAGDTKPVGGEVGRTREQRRFPCAFQSARPQKAGLPVLKMRSTSELFAAVGEAADANRSRRENRPMRSAQR